MNGLMMDMPLLISSILKHAARHHGDTEIVSRRVEGDIHRSTYRELETRSRQLASAFTKAGIQRGDRVATLAWNGYRHMEAYYAIGAMGSVVHTINPRLHPEQIAWMINHAEDTYMVFDQTFLPIIEAISKLCPQVKGWILMIDADKQPESSTIDKLLNYETFLATGDNDYVWPVDMDEHSAVALCYTSGTTGNPKGALYSHRSTVLHAYAAALPDAMGASASDSILPVVPMFHVNAWGLPYVAPLVGAKLVFPGPALDGKSIYELFEAENVSYSAGVPTVWLGLLQHVQGNKLKFNTLQRTIIGGSACPPAMIQTFRDMGVEVIHAWGMTEMSPLGTAAKLLFKHRDATEETKQKIYQSQGRIIYGVDMKIVNDEGEELPWDGTSFGNLLVRGPWVIKEYFKGEAGDPLQYDADGNGWFPTGDVATITDDGYMNITDRSKDVIKSGGEWISSIDLENLAMAHPAVANAAVIGIAHPKWDERPLLIVVKKPDAELDAATLIKFYDGKIAKWWTPDDVQFVDQIPLGATGKILKTKLREKFSDYQLPSVSS